jgi:hypothetical protein
MGDGRLGEVDAPCRLGEVACFRERDERSEVANLQHGRLFIINGMNDEPKIIAL